MICNICYRSLETVHLLQPLKGVDTLVLQQYSVMTPSQRRSVQELQLSDIHYQFEGCNMPNVMKTTENSLVDIRDSKESYLGIVEVSIPFQRRTLRCRTLLHRQLKQHALGQATTH